MNLQKTLYCILFVAVTITTTGQSNQFGTLTFQGGYTFGAHAVEHEVWQDGNKLEGLSGDAISSLGSFHFQAGLTDWLSGGFGLQRGAIIEDPTYPKGSGSNVFTATLEMRGYLGNTDNFNWYFGGVAGLTGLELESSALKGTVQETTIYRYHGLHFGIVNGFNWYFYEYLGMNFNMAFSYWDYNLVDYTINDQDVAIQNYTNTVSAIGMHLRLGLTARLF